MRHLFISNFETTRPLGKLLRLVAVVVVALVIIDYLLGRFIPYITIEPPFILRLQNVPGVEALWTYSAANVRPIVFTGSSQTYTGISPHQFDERLKVTTNQDIKSVNVSIVGSVVAIERDFIRNLIIPNHPQIIIYGIEMRALRSSSQVDDYFLVSDFRNKSLGYAVSQPSPIVRDASIWLLKNSNLVRYRDNLHDWLLGIRNVNGGEDMQTKVDDLGYAPFPNKAGKSPVNITSQFVPFTVDDATIQNLMDVSVSCRQNSIPCILLNTPLHQQAYEYITTAEETLYFNTLKQANLPIWDFNTEACRKILGDESFFNLNHLNSKGAEKFTQMIADVYAESYFNIPLHGDATCAEIYP